MSDNRFRVNAEHVAAMLIVLGFEFRATGWISNRKTEVIGVLEANKLPRVFRNSLCFSVITETGSRPVTWQMPQRVAELVVEIITKVMKSDTFYGSVECSPIGQMEVTAQRITRVCHHMVDSHSYADDNVCVNCGTSTMVENWKGSGPANMHCFACKKLN
jgi:hypothetical protein